MANATQDPLDLVAERIRARHGAATAFKAPATVYEYAKRYRMIDNRPFTLDRFKPLQALYEDDHPRIVIQKPAQRGVSEWAISLVCFALEYGAQKWVADGSKSGINVAIIFPAKADLNDFSKERLSDLKDETNHLASMFGTDGFDALGFKKVGDSFLYLRGGYSKAGLRSFPADLIIFDEYDELAPSAIALGRRRLNASLVKREIAISTPSIPGRGISAAYLASDQRVYQTQCKSCKSWNSYDFFRDVRADDEIYEEWQKWSPQHVAKAKIGLHCPVCKALQSDVDRCEVGRWISLQPEITRIHGYMIPWWAFPVGPTLEDLASSAVSGEGAEVEEFFHSDLGLAHGAGEGGITPEMLFQLSATLPNGLPKGPWRDTTMGCDVGSRLHYRISSVGPDGGIYVRAMSSATSWDQIDDLMAHYQVRQAVIDGEPEIHSTQDFLARWPGRAYRSFYTTSPSALRGILFNIKPNLPDVQVNRSMAMDLVLSIITGARENWPREFTTNPDIISQMTSSTRVKLTDEHSGEQRYDWVHVGADHSFHACVAAGTLIKTIDGEIPVEDIQAGMMVDTRSGPRRVSAAGITSPDSERWSYSFTDGRSLIATPNHPIWTENQGFIPIHSASYDDILVTCQSQSQPFIGESPLGVTQIVNAVRTEFTSHQAVLTVRLALDDYTKKFGKMLMGLFQKVSTYTILMKILSIIGLKISTAYHDQSTQNNILCRLVTRIIKQTSGEKLPGRMLPNTQIGIEQKKGVLGIDNMHKLHSELFSKSQEYADIAVRTTCPIPLVTQIYRSVLMFAFSVPVAAAGLTTLIASVQFVGLHSESISTRKPKRAQELAVESSLVRLRRRTTHQRGAVYNLSVEDAEEYYANGILVHNCVYDVIARRTLPQFKNQQPAVGGVRSVMTDVAVAGRPIREDGPSRLSVIR